MVSGLGGMVSLRQARGFSLFQSACMPLVSVLGGNKVRLFASMLQCIPLILPLSAVDGNQLGTGGSELFPAFFTHTQQTGTRGGGRRAACRRKGKGLSLGKTHKGRAMKLIRPLSEEMKRMGECLHGDLFWVSNKRKEKEEMYNLWMFSRVPVLF